jgi:trimeric autotransporter adhesin
MSFTKRRVVSILLAGAFAAAHLGAQSYQGGMRGQISDPGGAAIADAKVTLMDEATAVTRATLSNSTGEYNFTAVQPATYSVIVESPGFKRFERKGVVVATQQFLTVDIKLEVGQVSETINVTEEIPLIENATASNGQVLDRQKMVDLPNLGRNPFLLSKLSTNVVAAGDPRFNRFQDQSGSSQISVAGGPVRGNNYLIDGVPITDFNNRAVIIPSVEAVQEMKLQSNTYDAEMGRTGGGVFNTLLKSGTNDYHGSLLGNMRDSSFLANSFFNNRAGIARPDQPYKNYGASFGGAVRLPKLYDGRNRTFFWLAAEGYRQKSGLTQDMSVPTLLERSGDFSKSLTKAGAAQVIYDPLSGNTRTPFAGNKIPGDRINPVGLAVASYYPTPQRAAGFYGAKNFTGADTLFDRADEYTSKLDHEFTKWWRANASYLHYKSKEPSGNLLGTLPGSGSNMLFRKVDATQVNNILTPNATTVISVRYGFNRFPNRSAEVSAGFSPAQLGFPASYASTIQALTFPNMTFQDMQALGGTATSQSVFHSKNLLTSIAKFKGRHSLKAGFDYRIINVDFIDLATAPGQFATDDTFTRKDPTRSGDGTGADMASLLLGYPASGLLQQSTQLYTYVRYYSGYVHDDFRMSSKLTLNMGIRYEYETGLGERTNNFVTGFDRTAASPLAAAVPGTKGVLMFAGQNGAPTTCCNTSGKHFAPRFGFAYQLDPKTTVRGGYGLFFAPTRYTSDATFAPGFSQLTPYVASNDGGFTPAASLSNPFPAGILKPVGNTLGGLTGVGGNINFIDQNRGIGMVHQFSFDVQRELPGHIAVQVGYVASRSTHLQPSSTANGLLNINQVRPELMNSALLDRVANPYFGKGGSGVVGAATVTRAQLLKPYAQFGNLNAGTDFNHARYDSVIVKAQKRMSNGLTFLTSYTWSKNLDGSFASGNFLNASAVTAPQNYYDLASEYALAIVNTPSRLVATASYELPFGKGKPFLNSGKALNYVVGGWHTNFITIYQAGFPLSIAQAQNLNSIVGAAAQRPNATGISPSTSGPLGSRIDSYINRAAFSQAPQFTFGNLSRTSPDRGPGQANWDVSIFKDFKVMERFTGQFRAEALNLFNTPQFRAPNASFGSSTFGAISQQANFPRYMQLGIRLQF